VKKECVEVRRAVEDKGYDTKRGVFVQAFNQPEMDAALLLLPAIGFVDYNDERMVHTTDAVRTELEEDGLVRRYPVGNDEMEGEEEPFSRVPSGWRSAWPARADSARPVTSSNVSCPRVTNSVFFPKNMIC